MDGHIMRILGLFGPVARLQSDVPANRILRICTKTRDGERPSQEWRRACGRPSTTWVHQICRETGVSATEALLLAEDRPFWRTIATAGGSGWSLRVMMIMMMMHNAQQYHQLISISCHFRDCKALLVTSHAWNGEDICRILINNA